MKKLLESIISEECDKLIDRYYNYLYELDQNIKRKERRLNTQVEKHVLQPYYWEIDNGFNPFKVSKSKVIKTYAYTLGQKLNDLSYFPKTSLLHKIKKASGGYRELNIFQIPDSAISRFFYKSLLHKNVNMFSNYAYAYREDRNAHDAIHKISSDWLTRDRVYIAEFDFSKFFDQISHKYLKSILKNNGFIFTELEEYIIDSFLNSMYAESKDYNSTIGNQRQQGISQGTSISLFLANLACWELDNELERIGVQFARYADDTLIWSTSYERVVKAYDAIHHFSELTDVPLNPRKSEGITLLSDRENEELRSKSSVSFLGYDLSLQKVSISKKKIPRIKKEISYLIYENLLQPLKKGMFVESRISPIDWDYITAIYQIRRYLYGGLDDEKLLKFRLGVIRSLHFRGLMSYYPLVNDEEQLKQLDGWLIHTIKQSLFLRENLWKQHNDTLQSLPGPTDSWIKNITSIKKWINPNTEEVFDLRIPSFLMISRTMRVSITRKGIESVLNPRSKYYSEILGNGKYWEL